MISQIFVNLPVKDLDKSVEFFTKLGFTFNPQFTDKNATCMIIGENMFAMLLVEDYFKTFTKKEIPDTSKTAELTIALHVDSKDAVDSIVNKAIEAGGAHSSDKNEMENFMYGWSFRDLDGHIWEVLKMDENAVNDTPNN